MIDEHFLSELGSDWSDRTGCFGASLWGLYGLVVGSGARSILEVGVGKGGSATALLLAARRTDGHVWSMDVVDRTESVPSELRDRWSLILGRSQDLAELWERPLDFLFLDGEHTYAAARTELKYLGARVRPGGLIVMDDVWPMFPGVVTAFEQYAACDMKYLMPYGTPESVPGGLDRTFGVIRRA